MNIVARSIAGLLLAAAAVAAAGCGPIYLPAIYDANVSPAGPLLMEKPHTYVGADVEHSDGFNRNESHIFGRGHVSWGSGGRWGRGMISGYLYGGDYEVTAATNVSDRGHRPYLGIGAMFDGNLAIKGDDAAFGLGGNLGFSTEFGSYASLWDDDSSRLLVPMIGTYAFLAARIGRDEWAELQLHMGLPGAFSANLQFDLGKYLLWGGVGSSLASPDDELLGIGRFAAGVSVRMD